MALSRRAWKEWEVDYLTEWYGTMPVWRIARKVRHNKRVVREMARRLGLSCKQQKGHRVTPDQYIQIISEKAVGAGVKPSAVLRATTRSQKDRPLIRLKHEVWQDLRLQGESYLSIARVSGHDHSTIISAVNNMRRHAEMRAAT